jgi:hypothetical protein
MSAHANTQLDAAVARTFSGQFYRHGDKVWLVSAKGQTAKGICDQLGIGPGGAIKGVLVIPTADSYYGMASTNLWEWLKTSIEKARDE